MNSTEHREEELGGEARPERFSERVRECDGKVRKERRVEQKGEGVLWSSRKRRGSHGRALPDQAATKPGGRTPRQGLQHRCVQSRNIAL